MGFFLKEDWRVCEFDSFTVEMRVALPPGVAGVKVARCQALPP